MMKSLLDTKILIPDSVFNFIHLRHLAELQETFGGGETSVFLSSLLLAYKRLR